MFMITKCRQTRENGETNKFSMKNRWKSQCKMKILKFQKNTEKKTKFQQKNRWLFQRVCIDSRKIFPYFFDIFLTMKKFIVCWFFSYQKASYSTLANKWAFEQMEFLAEICLLTFREQMGIRTNGDSVPEVAELSRKWEDFD